jgi:hypothetical protein
MTTALNSLPDMARCDVDIVGRSRRGTAMLTQPEAQR